MDEEDAPRSTADAHAQLRRQAVRDLLGHPEDQPKPWNQSRPDGWPIAEAVYTFAHESTRGQVSFQLGMLIRGYPDAVILDRLAESGWRHMQTRLSRGELTATGIPDGETNPRSVDQSVFDQAVLDRLSMRVVMGSRHYLSVRVFDRAADGMPSKPSLPATQESYRKSKGGASPTYDWDAFRQELVRALFEGELVDRRTIRKHMRDWCGRMWHQQPDDRTIRDVLNPLFHTDIPEDAKRGN